MPLRRAIAALFAFALVAAACGDDDGGSGGLSAGDGFSIEGALAELPDLAEPAAIISVADLDRASELAGIDRPRPSDRDAILEWLMSLSGVLFEEQDRVLVPLGDLLRNEMGRPDEFADELGWNVADVAAFAEISIPPARALVVAGEDFDEDVFDRGDVVDLEDGVVTAGEGEDFSNDLTGRTAARPLGVPLRMAARDGLILATPATDVARDWLEGDAATLAEVEALVEVAAALDDADAYAAMLVVVDPEGQGGPGLSAPFDVVALGFSVVDDEAVVTIVHRFEDEDAAAEQVPLIEEVLTEGESIVRGHPIAEVLELDEVVADGNLTITTVRPTDEGHLRIPIDMVFSRDVLFG